MRNNRTEEGSRKNIFRIRNRAGRLMAFLLVLCMVSNGMVTPAIAAETSYASDQPEAVHESELTEPEISDGVQMVTPGEEEPCKDGSTPPPDSGKL